MKQFRYLFLACLSILALTVTLIAFQAASAAGIDKPCSQAARDGVAGERLWILYAMPTTPPTEAGFADDCNGTFGNNMNGLVRGAGDSILLRVTGGTTGITPPLTEQGCTLFFYWDEVNYQGTPGTNDFATTITEATCNALDNTVLFCTSDGTSGGSVRSGRVRFQIQATRGIPDSYDADSDSDGSESRAATAGTFECQPKISVFSDGNTGSSPAIYIGGDTIRTTITLTGQDGRPSSFGTIQIVCNAQSNPDGTSTFTTATVTGDVVIEGSPTTWNDDCLLFQNLTITRNSAIGGLTSVKYVQWNSTGAPAFVSFVNVDGKVTAANHTAKVLDRTLTATGSCAVSVDATTTINVPRGDDVDIVSCDPWKDARSANVPNARAGRAWVLRNLTYRVTTDFGSFDALFGSAGELPSNTVATTTAIDTSENAGLQYHKMVETFRTTARTDAVLQNWGNTSDLLDVNSHASWTSINNAQSPAGMNRTNFILGESQQFVQPKGLRDSANNLVSGVAASCTRSTPAGVPGSPVSHGNTDASGHGTEIEYFPVPPGGLWSIVCSSTFNGNTATYSISFSYVSPLTSNIDLVITYKIRVAGVLGIAAGIETVNPPSLSVLNSPDNPADFRFEVLARACDGCATYVIASGFLNQSPTLLWRANVTLPANYTDTESYLTIAAYTNFTGRLFLSNEQVHVIPASSGGSSTLPDTLAIPGFLIFLSLGGIAITFLTRENPIGGIAGITIQVVCLVMLWGQNAAFFVSGGTDFRPAVAILFSVAIIGLATRTYMNVRPSPQTDEA